ncbi:Cdc6/Cdc18 family protein [Cuniculiplasma sp. SKW3]|uniref:Cdc6/Cdc18 family protein n=1 Tax=Cuniculiplasma sp. SKW3 TaxID=3400170 RepID=UPI003FD4DC8D
MKRNIIRDPEPLENFYIPKNIIHRERQLRDIFTSVILPLHSGIGSTAFIYGQSGTGKTLTVKQIMEKEKDLHIFYENAISVTSFRKVMGDLAASMGISIEGKISYDSVFRSIQRIKSKQVLLIIDESLNLIRNDFEGLYSLVRSGELFGTSIGILIISVDNPALHLSSQDIRKLGIFNEIRFDPYTKNQIFDIVSSRASISLYEGSYSEEILSQIASLCERSGSARMGIEILQKSAFAAQYRGAEWIEPEDVRAASAMINPFITESKLMELDFKEILLLQSVCQILMNEGECTMESLSRSMAVNAEIHGIKNPDTSFIYRAIRHLETLDIVESRLESFGPGRGVRKKVYVNDVPVEVLMKKIQEISGRL